MRILIAAVFAVIGVPLILAALGTLAASPSVTDRTFAMTQVIAGLLCFLIAVVAGLMRPSGRTAAETPQPVAPPAAAAAAPAPLRDRLGMGMLIVFLSLALIVLAVQLRTPDREPDARAAVPVPASGSAPGLAREPVRSLTPAVSPAGRSEAGRAAVKAHAQSKARRVRDDD